MKRTKVITVTITTEEEGEHHFGDLQSAIDDIVNVYREGGDFAKVDAIDSENHLAADDE